MNKQETLEYLYGLERFGMVFGLENISRLLQALGDPHNDLKVIHVGGTNGKGSVSVMMAAVLQEEGYRVGLYTSPHLISFTERIQINGNEISWDEVIRLTDVLYGKVVDQNIPQRFTFFDFTTAIAMYYFFLQGVDVAILEVGLGGRLDSTNVVHPLMSVITNVDKDHYQILGERIEDIAREKAGIVKQGVPLISGATKGEVIDILEETCRTKGSPMRLIGRDFWGQRVAPRTFSFQGGTWSLDDIRLGVAGSYQIVNATVALAALELLEQQGYRIVKESMYHGLATVRWPGRLELIQQVPQILLDGAHNSAAAKALRACLQEEFDYQHIYMVMGVMEDKEVSTILAELAPLAEVLIATRPQNSRAMSPQRVATIAETYCKDVRVIDDISKGVDYARALAQEDDLIVVTGSLFTVGEARAHLINEKQV
ncbi:MAG: bifunctional folylpolyglutamate synthase/dihydrofolate synthase [Deltaproteobacteria bacterium]|nr:bifunctional folylpolyglutamate synthase/dihydrofolate synthase [Deltaproteobacteria bacterium]